MKYKIFLLFLVPILVVAVVLFLAFRTQPLEKRIANDIDYRSQELGAYQRLLSPQSSAKFVHQMARVKETLVFLNGKQDLKLPYMHIVGLGTPTTDSLGYIIGRWIISIHEDAFDALGVVIYWEEDGQEHSLRLPVISSSDYKKENRSFARDSTERRFDFTIAIGEELSYDEDWEVAVIPPDLLLNGFEIAVYDNKDNVSNRIKPYISPGIEWELEREFLIAELRKVESFDEFEVWKRQLKEKLTISELKVP